MSDHDTHSTIIVMHDHNPIAADLPKMQAGGVTAKVYQVEADVEIGAKFQSSAELFEGWADRGMKGMDAALRDIEANSEVCCLALTAADIERAKGQGKVAILLGAEGGKLLEASCRCWRNSIVAGCESCSSPGLSRTSWRGRGN